MIKVILKKGREDSVLRFHPWVFSGAIAEVQGHPDEGDVVAVHSSDGKFLAAGHWQIGSIAVRILSFNADALRPDFYGEMLSRAFAMRRSFGIETDSPGRETNCYRLVHGEGDNLPGLIIDYYDGVCVMQAHSVGMFRSRRKITEALESIYGNSLKAVYDKSSGTAPFKAGLELVDSYMYRRPDFNDDEQTVMENGHRFAVNWTSGQKTGFFLDQRDNRRLVEMHSSGRNVLNLFCYTGGFSVYALAGGASYVESVDSSAKAVGMAERNVAINGFPQERHKSVCTDAIAYLKDVPEGKFDLIIVDPPAFAKHRGALKNALRAYQRLNASAISKVASGGIVFTYSCSQVVDREAFALAVFSAAASTGRRVRILDRLVQPADHAVNIYHPEGEYLKGLLLYVE